MKQVVITAPLKYEVQQVPIPSPCENEVLVKMMAASVCGSDMHLFLGENPMAKYPRIPGHENAGIVEKVGKNVSTVKPGDRVVVDLVISCGECPQCLSGRKNVCQTVKSRGASADGGWREFFVVPEKEVYKISKDIPFYQAALVEPFAIGEHCTKRANVQNQDIVLVFGTGNIGAIILQTCKQIGCKVICADINDSLLKRAKDYGADYTINSKDQNLAEQIQDITNGYGVDVIFDAACYSGSLAALLQTGIIANGGRIVPLGFCSDYEQISQAMINGRELTIIGTRMSSGQFQPTIEKMEKDLINIEQMVSHCIPFSEINKVFDNIISPPEDMRKMVILFDK